MTELPLVDVETLPTKHRAIQLTTALLSNAETGRALADLVRGRLINGWSSSTGGRSTLEVPNWAKPGEFVPAYSYDWIVLVEHRWLVFTEDEFLKVFREDHGTIVLAPRILD